MGDPLPLWEGLWCSTDKTKWHRCDPQIVSDKDAAKRAARSAPTINRYFLSQRRRISSGRQVFASRARLRSGRRDAVPVPRTHTAAGGFLLQFRPE